MPGKPFAPQLEWIEDRVVPVAVPGVIVAPADFFGGPSRLVDFDRTPDGALLAPATVIADQYASIGVRFAYAAGTAGPGPVTSSPGFADTVSRPNSLYVGNPGPQSSGGRLVVSFDPAALGGRYPTAVGFVFTDAPPNTPFTAQAFDAAGNPVAQETISTSNAFATPQAGDTEDTFVGLQSAAGIARIEVQAQRYAVSPVVGYEIDNLRFNTPATPTVPPPPPGTGPGTPAPGFRPPDLLVASGNNSAQTYTLNGDQLAAAGGAVNPFNLPGQVRGASGDVNGDGATDLIYVTGPGGGGLIRVVSGRDGSDLLAGGAFNAFPGEDITAVGVFVAAGDINSDGRAEIVITPDRGGGPRVQIFSFANNTLTRTANFFGLADPNFRGGARVALGNFDGDEFLDLLVAAGIGGGPRVAVFDGGTILGAAGGPRTLVPDFFIFEQTLRDGVFVAAGDLNADGQAELVFGGGPGGGPRVLVLRYADVVRSPDAAIAGNYANFFAFDPNQRGGVRVAVKQVNGEDRFDLIAGSGDGAAAGLAVYRGLGLPTSTTATQGFAVFGGGAIPSGVYVG